MKFEFLFWSYYLISEENFPHSENEQRRHKWSSWLKLWPEIGLMGKKKKSIAYLR